MSEHRSNQHRASRGGGLVRLLLSLAIVAAGAAALVVVASAAWAPAQIGGDGSSPPSSIAGASRGVGDDPGAVTAPATQPVPVLVARAFRGDLVMTITASGTAEADRQLEVAAAQSGTIVELPVREGDFVARGDLLAAVDDTELRLNLQKARESLVTAIARFTQKRAFLSGREVGEPLAEPADARNDLLAGSILAEAFRGLVDDPRFNALLRTITREEVMAAQDHLMTERANFTQAELALERARTRSPFDGQVGRLQVVADQRVEAGTRILTLVGADPVWVRVEVLESEAGLARRGRRAEVRFAAYPGEVFGGRIEAISPVVDPEKRTLAVTVSLPNPGLRAKPGMFARVRLDTEVFSDRTLVPRDAVLLRGERPVVFVVRDEHAQWVYIERGRDNGEHVEVLTGVEPGDLVIVSGHFTLAHDAPVRIIEESPVAEAEFAADSGAR